MGGGLHGDGVRGDNIILYDHGLLYLYVFCHHLADIFRYRAICAVLLRLTRKKPIGTRRNTTVFLP